MERGVDVCRGGRLGLHLIVASTELRNLCRRSWLSASGIKTSDQRWPWWPLRHLALSCWKWFEVLVPALFLGFCAIGIDGVQLRHRGLDGFLKLAWNAFPVDWL